MVNVDGAKFVIGDSWTSTTAVITPIADEKDVILIGPLVTLDSLAKDDMLFRLMPSTRDMMVPLARYAYEKIGSRRAAILRQETPFGVEHATDFKEAFKKLGGRVVAEESFDIKTTDLRSQITKVKVNNPDTVFNLHATGPNMGILIRQARELGLNIKWLGSWGSENAALLKDYAPEIEGLVYPYPYDYQSTKKGPQSFLAAYKEKYGEATPYFAAASFYDSLKLLAKAINRVGEDPQRVRVFFLGIKNYDGAGGEFSFDANGDIKKKILIKTIKNSQFVKVEE